jgi:HK97 gp10 family phage protein
MAEFRESGDFEAGIQYATARYALAVAEAVKGDMEALCPVDTGELINSIKVEPAGDTVYVSVSAPHWIYVEMGTSKMRAQPFIRPALARRRDVVELGGHAF